MPGWRSCSRSCVGIVAVGEPDLRGERGPAVGGGHHPHTVQRGRIRVGEEKAGERPSGARS